MTIIRLRAYLPTKQHNWVPATPFEVYLQIGLHEWVFRSGRQIRHGVALTHSKVPASW